MTTTEAPPFDPATITDSAPVDVPPVPTTAADAGPTAVPPTPEPAAKARRGPFGRPAPRPTPKPDKRPAKAPREPKSSATLKRHVAELYTATGMMVLPFDAQCGTVVVNSADQCADALVKLSEENETVRRILEGMVQTSAIGGVIVAHMPIIMAVMAHHVAPNTGFLSDPGVSNNVHPFPEPDDTEPQGPTIVRDTEARRPAHPGPGRVRPQR